MLELQRKSHVNETLLVSLPLPVPDSKLYHTGTVPYACVLRVVYRQYNVSATGQGKVTDKLTLIFFRFSAADLTGTPVLLFVDVSYSLLRIIGIASAFSRLDFLMLNWE